jgi:ABC-type nitrate/sulfonate/bicarbonate transport system substrate-binding protein
MILRLTLTLIAILGIAGCGSAGSAHHSPTGTVSLGVPAAQATSLLLDWYPNSDHGGLYTALREGYFARRHVTPAIRVPSNATGQIELVAAGKAGFAITYETDLLAARARGLPVQSVMCIMQHPLDTVMTLQSSGITRPRQLVGRTVGMAGSPSDIPLVSSMMQHDGASISNTKMVNVGYNLLPSLLSKKVDAVVGVYWTWERIQAEMRGIRVNVMRVERWGVPNYCELVLVTNTRTIATNPGLVRSMVQAMQGGYADAEAHPLLAWRSLVTADATLRKQKALVTRSIVLLRGAVLDAPTIGYQNPTQWRTYAAWLAAHRMIAKPVNAQVAFTNRFLAPHVK